MFSIYPCMSLAEEWPIHGTSYPRLFLRSWNVAVTSIHLRLQDGQLQVECRAEGPKSCPPNWARKQVFSGLVCFRCINQSGAQGINERHFLGRLSVIGVEDRFCRYFESSHLIARSLTIDFRFELVSDLHLLTFDMIQFGS